MSYQRSHGSKNTNHGWPFIDPPTIIRPNTLGNLTLALSHHLSTVSLLLVCSRKITIARAQTSVKASVLVTQISNEGNRSCRMKSLPLAIPTNYRNHNKESKCKEEDELGLQRPHPPPPQATTKRIQPKGFQTSSLQYNFLLQQPRARRLCGC